MADHPFAVGVLSGLVLSFCISTAVVWLLVRRAPVWPPVDRKED